MPLFNTNDGSNHPPRLRCYLNLGTLVELPDWSTAPRGDERSVYEAIKAAGYEGIQGGNPVIARSIGLGYCDGGRVDKPGDAGELARRQMDIGSELATVHVGNGLEDDAEIDRLIGDILNACDKYRFPIYVETHRSTITQDVWRTRQFTRRHPEIRFNGDFSHWYTGLEIPYAGVDRTIAFAVDVLDRVRFMHGRIGNSSHMQVKFTRNDVFVGHFRQLWTRAFQGFLATARAGDYIVFAPEILFPSINYARLFPGPDGTLREESDRWEQALLMCELARECFTSAGV